MKKHLTLEDCSATAENKGLCFRAGCVSLSLTFDEDFGFVLKSFKNMSANNQVEYIRSLNTFMPIKEKKGIDDIKHSAGQFDEFVNFESSASVDKCQITPKCKWNFIAADIFKTIYGGAEVLSSLLSISDGEKEITLRLTVFPKCSVIRYNFEIKNISAQTLCTDLSLFSMQIAMDSFNDVYRAYWFKGGLNNHDYGKKCEQALGIRIPKIEISSNMTMHYIPLIVIARDSEPHDGFMIEMDYCARWKCSIERVDNSEILDCKFERTQKSQVKIPHDKSIFTPTITVAVYSGEPDNLMVRLYDWQYMYMWDYTQHDYYAKLRCDTAPYPWVYCSRILNEQFGYRLVSMDLHGGKMLAEAGMEMSWDDAGWSSFDGWPDDSYVSVFANTYEGPDHRLSTRFFRKLGLKRLIWFAGKPSLGVLGTKEGAWGEFEWRTDGLDNVDLEEEAAFKNRIKSYLDGGRKRSFHTCSGGARYASTFDIQRYANYNYACDSGAGPCKNYYYSYFMLPDRWGDFLPTMGGEYTASDGSHCSLIDTDLNHYYNPDHARANLSMCGMFAPLNYENMDYIREDVEVYHHLIKNGVAGRWSYMFHPDVYGDEEIYYVQRTSHDRLRACIIIRRRPHNKVIIYPKGLVADEYYTVEFDFCEDKIQKLGSELMDDGITIKNATPRELIYLNITPPKKIVNNHIPQILNAVCKRENNVGASGIGIYWSAETDGVKYYEIAKDGQTIAKLPRSHYWFDEDSDFENTSKYSVRTVSYYGNGEWLDATPLSGNKIIYSTLGSHGEDFDKNHWHAETSTDLVNFTPMKWTKPEKNPGADFRGTPNQNGGIEGYWESGSAAKIGRGWQQASPHEYCIRRFTVPHSGKINITGRAVKEWYHSEYGSNLEVFVMKNGEIIVPKHELRCSDINGFSYNEKIDVAKGDEIRFVLGKCDSKSNSEIHFEKGANIIGWNNIISYIGAENDLNGSSLKINCGSNKPVKQNGIWDADKYYTDGKAINNICFSDSDNIYSTSRIAEEKETISYNIPVSLGIYAVRLCFAEYEFFLANERFMKIYINGTEVEHELDIVHDAKKAKTPLTTVYHYIVPNERGEISITLTSERGGACISGIELCRECDDIKHINCGGDDFVDWAGYIWESDNYFKSGETKHDVADKFAQASPTLYDRELYLSARFGNEIIYDIPVKNSIYSVQLKFAEFELDKPGQRAMDIYINDVLMKKSFDILTTVGERFMSSDIRFDDISSDNGYIHIRIVALGNSPAVLRAIEID